MPKPKADEMSESEEDNDSDYGEDMLGMVEADDLEFLKGAITSKSYNIFNKVRYTAASEPKPKRRKTEEVETADWEDDYEDNTTEEVPMKNLLPIKTKTGIVPQRMVDDAEESEEDIEEEEQEEDFTFIDDKFDITKPISAAELLTERNKILMEKKLHIGTLSSGVLENPEEKVTNLRTLLALLDEEVEEVFYTVRKLATVSLLEIFKDLLPSYEIKKATNEGVKLKKDTLRLQRYEESLLLYYKKFLQKLEKMSSVLVKKMGDNRVFTAEDIQLGHIAVQGMCELLVTHPYFNFAQNVAQAVVPFLNNRDKAVREIVKQSIKTLFKEDKREEITLKVLRIINNYLKNHAHNVHPDVLEVFLVLNLRDVNLDQEKEQDMKQKKLMARKAKIQQQSKKERKRKKRLKLLEQELLETKAEESKQTKMRNLAEITKIVFGIYFRILKSSTNTKVLGICLEGLAKYSHCINMEFYLDLVKILDGLMKEDWISYKEQLHCIQTVFSILSGQGEALNLDPSGFYTTLYKDLLTTNVGRNHSNFIILLKTLNDALLKRRKKITNKRLLSFIKRLTTLSLQLLHNGALASLSLVKSSMQLNRGLDVLLDMDTSFGDGKFQPMVNDPEYANASSSALYELSLLVKHYHPVVRKYAKYLAFGVPSSGEGSLDPEYAKLNPEELYNNFDMSEMGFNPSIPPPKPIPAKIKTQRHLFADSHFGDECKTLMRAHLKQTTFL